MIVQVQCCFMSTETMRTISDGEPTSTFTQLLNSDMIVQVQCCFTSTETTRAITSIRDGEPRKATSTFTQLLSSASKRGLNNLYLNYKPAFPLNPCRRFCYRAVIFQLKTHFYTRTDRRGVLRLCTQFLRVLCEDVRHD